MPDFTDQQLKDFLAGANHPELEETLETDPNLLARLEEFSGVADLTAIAALPPLPEDEEAPTELAGFRIIREVGRGGMGVVYEAEDEGLKRRVALKLISPAFCYSPEFVTHFAREAELGARLDHPQIVPIYRYDVEGNRPFLVMKLIQGPNLSTRLRESERLKPKEVSQIIRDLCFALAEAHQNAVLHCDLKPSNVLLDLNGRAYLSDFGIARLLDEKNAEAGTAAYQAPELGGKNHSQASDLFALGQVISELSRHHSSPRIKSLIVRLTAKNPDERELGNFSNLSASPSWLKWILGAALLLALLFGLAHFSSSEEGPEESSAEKQEAFSGDPGVYSGDFQLPQDLVISESGSFLGEGGVLHTDASITVKADVIFSDLEFIYGGRESLFHIVEDHTVSFKNCCFYTKVKRPPVMIGAPLIAVSGGSGVNFEDCVIHAESFIALGSFPQERRSTDRISLLRTEINAEVAFFRARSGGDTEVTTTECLFQSKVLISQNARSGRVSLELSDTKVSGELLYLPSEYPHPPQNTLRLHAVGGQLPEVDPSWGRQEP